MIHYQRERADNIMFKYTLNTLNKIENIFKESGYIIRYEKGSFTAGYCLLENKKVIVINKFFSIEGKINCFIELLPNISINEEMLSEKSLEFFRLIQQQHLKL